MKSWIRIGQRVIEREDMVRRIAQVATGLESLGVKAGDGIAMLLRNDIAFLEVGQATSRIGAYPVAVNWHSTVEEVRYVLSDCGARILVIHADLLHTLGEAIPEGVTVLAVKTQPEIAQAYAVPDDRTAVPPGMLDWDTWRDSFAPRAGPPPEQMPNTIIYTSGTTGKPKGVRRAAFTEAHGKVVSAMLMRCYGLADETDIPEAVITAIIGPVYHSAPNAHANVMFGAGANIIIFPRFDPEELLAAIERYRITHLNMVPIMFTRLLKLPAEIRAKYDLSSLRFIAHAAAPCPPSVKHAMIEWWGPVINEYYGTTEMGNVTFCSAADWLSHPGTVGRLLPGAEVRVVDANGRDMPPRGIGEVIGRTRGLAEFTYHGDDEKRRRADKFGLFTPGDVGYFDEDGFLYLCDRANDMIISGGVNIYPAEIEAELHKMPEVADCAVFGIPDEEFGESIFAVIQPQASKTLTEEVVKTFLRAHISSYKIPKRIIFATDLPRQDSGKIFKRKLRDPFWAETGRQI